MFRSSPRVQAVACGVATMLAATTFAASWAAAQSSKCVEKRVVTITAQILDSRKLKFSTAYKIDASPYPECRIEMLIVRDPPATCIRGARISATGEIAEMEDRQGHFEIWNVKDSKCQ